MWIVNIREVEEAEEGERDMSGGGRVNENGE